MTQAERRLFLIRSLMEEKTEYRDLRVPKDAQGQRQLLAISRAVAADPKILLLDEITADLDAETEHCVLAALRSAAGGRTVVSISHRLYEEKGSRRVEIG